MLFEISNDTTGRKSHCGVLEFIADEGVVYMPHWVSPVQADSICPHRLLAPFTTRAPHFPHPSRRSRGRPPFSVL